MPQKPVVAKDHAIAVIQEMPADSSLEDIIRELLMHRMVMEGLEDAAAGRLKPHDDVEKEVETWFRSSGRHAPPAA